VHPDQIRVIDEVFTPSEAKLARAREIVAAFDTSESEGVGNIDVSGQFIDYPVAHRAKALIALADSLQRGVTRP
jgi:citrate lyase subunit beta/citryl-CoA lyase